MSTTARWGRHVREHRRRRRGVRGDAGPEPAVDVGQGQLHHPGEDGLVEHQQHARGPPRGPGGVRSMAASARPVAVPVSPGSAMPQNDTTPGGPRRRGSGRPAAVDGGRDGTS